MKYIDAEKLIAEIEKRIIEHKKSLKKDITLISETMLKGSLGAYESIERFITSLQQGQSEVDLEKEIKRYQEHYILVKEKGFSLDWMDIETTARHFYELGLNARKEVKGAI